jgi:hypothetical protein
MAVIERVTRRYIGPGQDGQPLYQETHHGRPRTPESPREWAEQRVAALGDLARALPAGRVAVALLLADGDAAVQAAAAAHRGPVSGVPGLARGRMLL